MTGEAVSNAVLLRDYERHGIDATQRVVRVRGFARAERESRVVLAHEFWSQELAAMGIVGRRLDVAEFLPPSRIIDEIVAFQPKYLRINPIRLEQLCNWDRERRLGSIGIEAVLSYQEHLSAEARHTITDHIGCKILDRYGSNECGAIASSCAQCGRFHVHAESVFTEIVDDSGAPTSQGETGWVIATPLFNFAMPLIRYHHADRAKVGRAGLCSVTLPSLDSVIGKEPVMFKFAGSLLKPVVPPSAIINYLGAQKFQVAQVAEDRCEFRIVAGRIAPSEMRFEEMTRLLRERWWKDLKIDYRVMDELPTQDRRQKPAVFVREIKD
jgi:phenylacetate-CoA ligase